MLELLGFKVSMAFFVRLMLSLAFFVGIILMVSSEAFAILNKDP